MTKIRAKRFPRFATNPFGQQNMAGSNGLWTIQNFNLTNSAPTFSRLLLCSTHVLTWQSTPQKKNLDNFIK